MGVFDIFSKRQRALRGEFPDVYRYDTIPNALKVQVIHIWRETLGDEHAYQDGSFGTKNAYQFIVETLCREYGVFVLSEKRTLGYRHYIEELSNFLLHETADCEKTLDAIELSFKVINAMTRRWDYIRSRDASEAADRAIEELNMRFREHGVGYEFTNQEIIRIDSRLLHAEAVKPALMLLREPEYKGAQAEFLTAHEHYRHGRRKEALTECLKALESTMKAICSKRRWTHDKNATANTLVKTLFDNNLIPPFWNAHFTALRSTLEAGVPTARNKLGGHGQGTEIVEVPDFLVGYVLHLTASAILFLASAEKALP